MPGKEIRQFCHHCKKLVPRKIYLRHKQIFGNRRDRLASSCSSGETSCAHTHHDSLTEMKDNTTDEETAGASASETTDSYESDTDDDSVFENSDVEDNLRQASSEPQQIPGFAKTSSASYAARTVVASILYFLLFWQAVHMVSNAAMSQILSFISQFLTLAGHHSTFCAGLAMCFPASLYLVNKWMGIDSSSFERYICCPKCMAIYHYYDIVRERSKNSFTIRDCSNERLQPGKKLTACGAKLVHKVVLKNGIASYVPYKVYVYNSIISSLECLLRRPGLEKNCQEWRDRSGNGLSDVYDGRVWRQFSSKPDGAPFLSKENTYAFMMNVDWFQPYKHRSDISIGVIYLAILNLPRHIRFRRENVIVAGIIPAFPSEPKHLNTFLKPIVNELNRLWHKGVSMRTYLNPSGCTVSAALICAAADIPAARKLCGFLSHSAKLGCSKCLKQFPGSVGSMNYGGFSRSEWPDRSVEQHRNWAQKIDQCKNVTQVRNLESQCGYRFSALLQLSYFDTVKHHVIDPMHNLFLGTAKHMFNVWLKCNILCDADFVKIQEQLSKIKIATDCGWLPRGFTSNWRSFNAHEWKCWTLIYSLYALKGILPDEDYVIWSLFVLACQKIAKPYVTYAEVTMFDNLILRFLLMFERKYGSEFVTPNMHMHAHLKECVLNYGSVYGFWLFSFENLNKVIGTFRSPYLNSLAFV